MHTGSNYTTKLRRTLHGGHEITTEPRAQDFADALWQRFQPLDDLLQADEYQVDPGSNYEPTRYFIFDLPKGADMESFVARWANGVQDGQHMRIANVESLDRLQDDGLPRQGGQLI